MFCHKNVANTCVEKECGMWVIDNDGNGACAEAMYAKFKFYLIVKETENIENGIGQSEIK